MLPILVLLDWAAGEVVSVAVSIVMTTTVMEYSASGDVVQVMTAATYIESGSSVNMATSTQLMEVG
jgi:hypothetical protein